MATELTTAAEVMDALRKRFPSPAWAMFAGVSNGTGRHAGRWADAVAMSVWPSRGLELVGFEIKVDRGDLLRELKNPKKADAVGKYCDRWWIAAGSKAIAKPEELPPGWGLLVPHAGTMKIVKGAPELNPEPLDRVFLAAILRRAAERYDVDKLRKETRYEVTDQIRREMETASEKRWAKDIENYKSRADKAQEELWAIRKQLHDAVELQYDTKTIGAAIALLNRLRGWQGAFKELDHVATQMEVQSGRLNGAAEAAREALKVLASLDSEKS